MAARFFSASDEEIKFKKKIQNSTEDATNIHCFAW